MNTFYLAYEIYVQNFVRLWQVAAEICWKWVEILLFHFRVRFFIVFLWFFFYKRVLFSLRNSRSKFHAALLCCCGYMLKMGGHIHFMTLISFIVSTLFPCIWGFIIIKGVTNIYNIYKCYEHFNHKMIRIFLWDGMDGKKCIWIKVQLCLRRKTRVFKKL